MANNNHLTPEDQELKEITDKNNLSDKLQTETISIDIPLNDEQSLLSDKEKLKKGAAIATAALLGVSAIGGVSAFAGQKYKERIQQYTEDTIDGKKTFYNNSRNAEDHMYVSEGKMLKTYMDQDNGRFLKVFTSSERASDYSKCYTYNFSSPEFEEELYIPVEDSIEYLSLKILVDEPTAECSNFRMTPELKNDNIARKISKDTTIYIKRGPYQRNSENCWFEALYVEKDSVISGFYCITDEEYKKGYVDLTLENYTYTKVAGKTRLYTKEEVYNMYYEVTNKDGVIFTPTPGSYENSTFIPYGSIIRGTPNITIKKSEFDDKYTWIQCVVEIDGKNIIGYVPYSMEEKTLLKKVPVENIPKITSISK